MHLSNTIIIFSNRFFNSFTSKSWITLLSLIGVMIAWKVMSIQQGWVTDDTVLYFEVAKQFTNGQFKVGLTLYNWPFYPALIAIIQYLTGLSVTISAQALNLIFFAVTTLSFLSIVRIAGGTQHTIFCAAFLLFSSTYIVGDILPMLIRDQGFWASYLTSVYFFILYARKPSFKLGLFWQIFALIAILFRVEAITFFILLPCLFLFKPLPNKFKTWFNAQSLGVLALAIILAMIGFSATLSLRDLGRINEIFTIFGQIYTNLTEVFSAKAHVIASQVMGSFLDEFGMLVLLSGLLCILIYKCLFAGGALAAGLIIFKIKSAKSLIKPDAIMIFGILIALSSLNAVMILASVFLLSGRYIVSLGFILLILSAFCLDSYLQQAKTKVDFSILTLIFLIILLSIISNLLPKKAGHNYEQHAVNWAKQHTVNQDNIFYVSPRARYYASAPYQGRGYDFWDFTKTAILNRSILEYDTLVINIDVHQDVKAKEEWLLSQLPEYSLLHKEYSYKNKKRMLVFKKKLVDTKLD